MKSLLTAFFFTACLSLFAAEPNQLTENEKREGWVLLFDGQSTREWRTFNQKTFPSSGWKIEEGCLKHAANGGGGDIISDRAFDDFEFSFEWKVAPGANSGVKYFIVEERGRAIGHEYQLIDDDKHPDALRGDKWKTGAFYDVLPATNKTVKPVGEFNHSLIRVKGNHVEHWLNGKKVLEYELGSPEVLQAVAGSKFKTVQGFGTKVRGHLLLQDHHDEISFRNLKVRELTK